MPPPTPRRTSGVPARLARTNTGVLRPRDAALVYAQPRPEFLRMTARGDLHRLATGYYALVPPGAREREWKPSLEAAAYGIAAADYGAELVVLMGLSAARMHGAIPRALSVAVVAVPKQRPMVALVDRDARVVFVRRDTSLLRAERMRTDLGHCLVTTVEQTVLDLARRPELGGVETEAGAATVALLTRCDPIELNRLAADQRGAAALRRARAWAAE